MLPATNLLAGLLDEGKQGQLAADNMPHSHNPPSLSTATTLNDESSHHRARLHLSPSQHSLARPLEEAPFSLASTPHDLSRPSVCSDAPSSVSDSDSQHSYARPLEEATYPQDTSPSLSEPASSQPVSTQSSGPYMPPAFLRYHCQPAPEDLEITEPLPTALSLGASLDIPPVPGSVYTRSNHSSARAMGERDSGAASLPLSLLAEVGDDIVNTCSRHSLARPLKEVTDLDTDSPPIVWPAGWDSTTRPQTDRTLDEPFRRLHPRGQPAPKPSRSLTPQRLDAIGAYLFGQCSSYSRDNTVVEPVTTPSANTVSSLAPSSSIHGAGHNPGPSSPGSLIAGQVHSPTLRLRHLFAPRQQRAYGPHRPGPPSPAPPSARHAVLSSEAIALPGRGGKQIASRAAHGRAAEQSRGRHDGQRTPV